MYDFIDNEYEFWNELSKVSLAYYSGLEYNKISDFKVNVYNRLPSKDRKIIKELYKKLYSNSASFIRYVLFFEDIGYNEIRKNFKQLNKNFNNHTKEINYKDTFIKDCELIKKISIEQDTSVLSVIKNHDIKKIPYIVKLYNMELISFETIITLSYFFKDVLECRIYDVEFIELIYKIQTTCKLFDNEYFDIDERKKIFVEKCIDNKKIA